MKKKPIKSTKSIEKKLWQACSTYIRKRDSVNGATKKGYCISCNQLCEGKKAHAGHYMPKKESSLYLRYHPDNIHLQCQKCNVPMTRSQTEAVKVRYALAMHKKYGNKLYSLMSLNDIKTTPTVEFYEQLTELFNHANKKKILDFLKSYCYNTEQC